MRPAHSQPLIDWKEVSSLCRFICVLITFVSHHRLLTRGHDLAVLSIMPFSILETCHLIVKPCTRSPSYCAVIVTSTLSSSHADSYRLDRSIVYRVAYSACIVFWRIVVQHICILILKCVPSLASKSSHTRIVYGEECPDYCQRYYRPL